MEFRVYLDDTQYTDVEIESLNIKYERSVKERGFVTKFSDKARFRGDSFAYLYSVFLRNPCAEIDCLVQIKDKATTPWETYLDGILIARDFEVDEQKCLIESPIEENGVNGLFLKYKSKDIDFTATSTLNNAAAISPNRVEIQDFFDSSGVPIVLPGTIYGYLMSDAFDFMLRYMTDNRLWFVSDFMSTNYIKKEWSVVFSGTPALGEVITVTLEDEMNNTVIANITSDGNAANFASDFIRLVCKDYNGQGALAQYYEGIGMTYGEVVSTSPITILLRANEAAPTLVAVVSSGSTTATITLEEDYIRNAANYYLSDGIYFNGDITDREPFKLSFDKLFEWWGKAWDLSYSIENIGDQWYLRMEPMEYFISETTQATLDNVPNIHVTAIEERIESSIKVGSGYWQFSRFSLPTYQFVNLDCGGGTIDNSIPDDVHCSNSDFANQIGTSEDFGEDLFLVKCGDPSGGIVSVEKYSKGVIGDITYFTPNAALERRHLLLPQLFFCPDQISVDASTFTRTYLVPHNSATYNEAKVTKGEYWVGTRKQYIYRGEFDYPLTYTQFKAIDARGHISFSSPKGTRLGYIEELDRNPKTGMARFKLLVKQMQF